jgi:hypothetical protein
LTFATTARRSAANTSSITRNVRTVLTLVLHSSEKARRWSARTYHFFCREREGYSRREKNRWAGGRGRSFPKQRVIRPPLIAACAPSPNSELAARVLPCPKLTAGGSNEAIARGAVSILARRNNGNEYLWRTGRSRRLQLAGQRTRGSNIGRGKWTRHCWRTNAVTALAAGPVAQRTVPAKSSSKRRLHGSSGLVNEALGH